MENQSLLQELSSFDLVAFEGKGLFSTALWFVLRVERDELLYRPNLSRTAHQKIDLCKWSSTQEFRVDLAGLVKTNWLGFSTLEGSSLIRLKMVIMEYFSYVRFEMEYFSYVWFEMEYFSCTVWVFKIYTEPILKIYLHGVPKNIAFLNNSMI